MAIRTESLDHVALWVADRDPLADFLCDHLGMHVIERTDAFTLVGADALKGKLTLFAADGPREPGALRQVVLRVSDLDAALGALPVQAALTDGVAGFDAPEGLRLGLVESREGVDYDIDHVVLAVPDPDGATQQLAGLGFDAHDGRLAVADRHVRLERGAEAEGERPLLNHLALLVDSADDAATEAERHGAQVLDMVDAPNTRAAFVWGPARIKLEYVEHKPGFSLT